MRTTNKSVKQAICAWCGSHALDVADGEVVDLVRRRTEVVVRCRVRQCNQSFRAWLREDSGIEDTQGKPINDEFGTLLVARCERHRERL